MPTRPYTTRLLSAAILLSSLSLVYGEDAPQTKKAATNTLSAEELASRKASIPHIEARIKDREQQINYILEDSERINTHIESRIDKIVKTLAKIKDSQNSKIRVAHMKQKTMKELYQTIENYKRFQATLKEQLRTGKPDIGKEAATKGVEMFDSKIEKRAAQLVEISKSFTDHVDYKKYENDSSSNGYGYNNNNNGWGWGWDNSRVSEEWKQNRRETTFTDGQKKKMINALKESIKDIDRRNNTLRIKSKESSVSEATKKFYLEDIARNEKTRASRSKQLEELLKPNQATTESVSRNQAHDTELLIREISKDIQREGNKLLRNYNELKQQLVKLNRTKKNLEARKAWLKKYDEAQQEKTSK